MVSSTKDAGRTGHPYAKEWIWAAGHRSKRQFPWESQEPHHHTGLETVLKRAWSILYLPSKNETGFEELPRPDGTDVRTVSSESLKEEHRRESLPRDDVQLLEHVGGLPGVPETLAGLQHLLGCEHWRSPFSGFSGCWCGCARSSPKVMVESSQHNSSSGIAPKMIHEWPRSGWQDAGHQQSLAECKSNPRWDSTSLPQDCDQRNRKPVGKDVQKLEPSHVAAGGNPNGTATVHNSSVVPPRLRLRFPYDLIIPLLSIYLRELKTWVRTKVVHECP